MNTPMWMVRASGQAARSGVFFESGVVALGVGQELGAIPEYAKPEDLHEALRRAHPSWRPGRHKAVAGQLHCFLDSFREVVESRARALVHYRAVFDPQALAGVQTGLDGLVGQDDAGQ